MTHLSFDVLPLTDKDFRLNRAFWVPDFLGVLEIDVFRSWGNFDDDEVDLFRSGSGDMPF